MLCQYFIFGADVVARNVGICQEKEGRRTIVVKNQSRAPLSLSSTVGSLVLDTADTVVNCVLLKDDSAVCGA